MRAIGKENIWFSFNAIRNDEVGVRMLSMPTRPHPARKGRVIDIPGADIEAWQDEGGYKRIIIPIRLITADNANIDEVNAWLSGEGDLIFGDEPERLYHARITKEFSRSNRSQRLRGQEFTISFDCEPYRYKVDTSEDGINLSKNPISQAEVRRLIANLGTVEAAPIIVVNGSGEGTLTLGAKLQVTGENAGQYTGGKTLSFSAFPSKITVDCAAKIAYTGSGTDDDPYILATQYVSGEWPTIPTGFSYLVFDGNVDDVSITPRWRWL